MIPACLGVQVLASDQTSLTIGGFCSLGVVPGALVADGSAGTSATTGADAPLKSATVPAGALNTPSAPPSNARGLRIRAWGSGANNANAKGVEVDINGTTVSEITITASVAALWHVDLFVLVRTFGSAGALSVCSHIEQGTGAIAGTGTTVANTDSQLSSQNLLNAITIVVNATAQVAASDVTCDGIIVEIF